MGNLDDFTRGHAGHHFVQASRRLEELTRLRQELEALRKPFAMPSIGNPAFRLARSLNPPLPEGLRMEGLLANASPLIEMQQRVQKFLNPLRGIADSVLNSPFAAAVRNLQAEALRGVALGGLGLNAIERSFRATPTYRAIDQFRRTVELSQRIAEATRAVAATSIATSPIPESLRSILQRVQSLTGPAPTFSSDGLQLRFEGEEFEAADVRAAVKEALADLAIDGKSAPDGVVELPASPAEGDPRKRRVVDLIVFPLLVLILWTLLKPVLFSAIDSKQVSLLVVQNFLFTNVGIEGREALVPVRMVARDDVVVRGHAQRKSARLGVLHAGDLVLILHKGRRWSKVAVLDPSGGDWSDGWVFSRYLARVQ